MSGKILIVEDEKAIAELIQLYLAGEQYEVFVAYSGEEAFKILETEIPDLAILDIMLPDISGFDICKFIRKTFKYPILFLTAKDDQIDKIQGLTLGADDYITKPFKPLELVARVKANLRRYKDYNDDSDDSLNNLNQDSIQFGDIRLNTNSHEATINDEKLELTPKEFGILSLLLSKRGIVINSEDIFYSVWGEKYYDCANNTIMVHIRHLRQKMNKKEGDMGYIKTVWGVGYMIDAQK
ncbi:two-component system, OmpR family, response regulator VanR [Enterococcus sp. DIV0212c]|uniref:response regulator transcription factor n=1 Tax=Enterococcus sp. DIV0212c TaxID=2230867 RepID=UPI001A9BF2F2|nr:response regulator transcription factor [Enterococcus sp. DIV0212c]MBO1354100.1 response regulator transcription factor [Enterococcus sp. DIV0212c]